MCCKGQEVMQLPTAEPGLGNLGACHQPLCLHGPAVLHAFLETARSSLCASGQAEDQQCVTLLEPGGERALVCLLPTQTSSGSVQLPGQYDIPGWSLPNKNFLIVLLW